jgi:soluble lytic murein transglycosylase-like protein
MQPLVLAVIRAESNFNPTARSPKNAQGLMQLIPDTCIRFNVKNPYDPVQNLRGGLSYLRWLLAHFEGDVALVAAAYNSGEQTVNRYRGVPPYAETRAYVRQVREFFGRKDHPVRCPSHRSVSRVTARPSRKYALTQRR